MEYEQNEQNEQPISVGQWMLNLFITYLPLVNFIMLIVWAVSNDIPKSKSNWAKARLIWMAIGIFLAIMFYGLIFAFIAAVGGFDNF